MNRTMSACRAALAMLTGTVLLAAAGEPEFKVSRSTIDGSGTMRSTGGDFELSATVGQHDAEATT